MKNAVTPKSREAELVIQETDGEVLIYDLRNDKAICLNSSSAIVWQACDGNKTVPEIKAFVSKKLNANINEDLIWLALDQLKKEKLIENGNDISIPFAGMSRREVIKKVGFASVIALPLVTALVAPLAIHAASNCVVGAGTCTCQGPNGGQGNVCTPTASTCNVGCVCRYANNGNNNGVCAP